MTSLEAAQQLAAHEKMVPLADYNYEHFRTKHLLEDGKRTLTGSGIMPGEIAPDFVLPQALGGTLRLSDLRDGPVLLHFGSYT